MDKIGMQKKRAQAIVRGYASLIAGLALRYGYACEVLSSQTAHDENEFEQKISGAWFMDEQVGFENEFRILSPIFLRSIESLNLPNRSTNALKKAEVLLIGDLVHRTPAEVFGIRGLGSPSVVEIEKILASYGMSLGMRLVSWPPPDGYM